MDLDRALAHLPSFAVLDAEMQRSSELAMAMVMAARACDGAVQCLPANILTLARIRAREADRPTSDFLDSLMRVYDITPALSAE